MEFAITFFVAFLAWGLCVVVMYVGFCFIDDTIRDIFEELQNRE